jgi:hypothetical protein
MKNFAVAAIVSAMGLAFVLAAPAEAKDRKDRKSATAQSTPSPAGPHYQGGVMAGPLYNGQDYLGDDPDPNIRAYLLRDLTGRYGGGR